MAPDIIQLRRQGIDLRADQGAGFVDQVDGLVGQETVGDIAVGQGGGGNQRGVLNFDAVENLISLLQAAQDRDRILDGRLGDHDRLEPALEGGVLLDIFPVFVECRGADAVQLAPGQHRLEQVARVHGAVGLAGADDRMQLIDKEQDSAFALADFLQDGLQPLLKLAAELRAGDQAAHIQGENRLVLQAFGHVAADDPQRQPFGDGCLADTRLADQDRIVFRLAGKNADDIPDFGIPADDRIQLLLPGQLDQVGTVFLQGVIGILRAVRRDAGGTPDLHQRFQERFRGITEGFQQAADGGGRLRAQADPQMLDGKILVLHLLRGFLRLEQRLFYIGGIAGLGGGGTGYPGHAVQILLQGTAESLHRDAAAGKQLRNQILRILRQGGNQMLLLHIHVAVFHGKRLGPLQGGERLLRQLIHIH